MKLKYNNNLISLIICVKLIVSLALICLAPLNVIALFTIILGLDYLSDVLGGGSNYARQQYRESESERD